MPNVEAESDGAFLKGTREEPNGAHLEIMYNLEEGHADWVLRTSADKSAVSVGFSRREGQNALGIHSGYVKDSGGQRGVEIWFDDEELARPRWAISIVGPGLVLGKVVAWDKNGNMVVDREITSAIPPLEVRTRVLESLDADEFEALEVSLKDRLRASPAFRRIDGMLRRSMENLAGWSQRFLEAEPNEYVEMLHGRDMEVAEVGDDVVYRIDVGESEPEWTIFQDHLSGRLEVATRGELSLYFDMLDDQRCLAGGRCPDRNNEEADSYWLISFYPGKCAPRMAVAAKGEPPTDLNVEGKLFVWGPDGEILIEKSIETARAVAEVVQEIDAALTEQEKQAVNWRGLQEANYLLGQY
ncbi:MAG: hypothetical protein AMXMBFR82_03860 [Candidatus Hydrogenedentota bacterium]